MRFFRAASHKIQSTERLFYTIPEGGVACALIYPLRYCTHGKVIENCNHASTTDGGKLLEML